MPTYQMVYGDDEQVVRQTFENVEVNREDGWTVLFRGPEAILRVRDEHVQSLELLEEAPGTDVGPRRSTRVTVGELMRPAVVSVEQTAHLAAATYLMRKAGDTALVVCEDSTHRVPVAVITFADIARTVGDGRDPNDVRISELVGRTPITVSPAMGVVEAAELMLASHINHLPVVEGNQLLGIVDVVDACRGLLTTLRGSGG
jgi:CBS domain-containing protein